MVTFYNPFKQQILAVDLTYQLYTSILPNTETQEAKLMYNKFAKKYTLPFTHIGGAPVAFATRNDIAISSQFLVNQIKCELLFMSTTQLKE